MIVLIIVFVIVLYYGLKRYNNRIDRIEEEVQQLKETLSNLHK
ncbi:hypothetical protein [Salirhabdus salicampi]|nr:hypothetical protein [Salirhabdus salicampi]